MSWGESKKPIRVDITQLEIDIIQSQESFEPEAYNTPIGRYYRLQDGSSLPSVTTVLQHFESAGLQKWRERVGDEESKRISDDAKEFGTNLHKLAEEYLTTGKINTTNPTHQASFLQLKDTIGRINKLYCIEKVLYSKRLGLAGRTDVIGEFDGVLSIIDFKTSRKLKSEAYIQHYFEQATAYALMWMEKTGQKVEKLVIPISIRSENYPQVFFSKPSNHIDNLYKKIKKFGEIYGKEY